MDKHNSIESNTLIIVNYYGTAGMYLHNYENGKDKRRSSGIQIITREQFGGVIAVSL